MKLSYRGQTYNYNPSVAQDLTESIHDAYTVTYRGMSYTVDPRRPSVRPSALVSANLRYRGVEYCLNGGQPEARSSDIERARSGLANLWNSSSFEVAQVHRTHLQENVQRRLQVAREQGNQTLVQLLEQELQQIA